MGNGGCTSTPITTSYLRNLRKMTATGYEIVIAIGAVLTFIVLFGTQIKTLFQWGKSGFRWVKQVFTTYEQVEKNRSSIDSLSDKIDSLSKVLNDVSKNVKQLSNDYKINGAGESLRVALLRERNWKWRDYELNNRAVWETGKLVNGEFGCIRATSALERLVGTSPLGNGWLTALPEEDREEIQFKWDEAMRTGSSYQSLQRFRHRDAQGRTLHTKYVWAHFMPEYSHTGELMGGLGACEELTEDEYFKRLEWEETE